MKRQNVFLTLLSQEDVFLTLLSQEDVFLTLLSQRKIYLDGHICFFKETTQLISLQILL
jgi:hypothetical protein